MKSKIWDGLSDCHLAEHNRSRRGESESAEFLLRHKYHRPGAPCYSDLTVVLSDWLNTAFGVYMQEKWVYHNRSVGLNLTLFYLP